MIQKKIMQNNLRLIPLLSPLEKGSNFFSTKEDKATYVISIAILVSICLFPEMYAVAGKQKLAMLSRTLLSRKSNHRLRINRKYREHKVYILIK